MSEFGINIDSHRRGTSQYSADGRNRWDLAEAERIAFDLLESRKLRYVAFGDGTYEFRMWGDDADRGNFGHGDGRWAAWFVDAEINGRRWRYRPLADFDTWEAADAASGELDELAEVTRIWVGASDGSEVFDSESREG